MQGEACSTDMAYYFDYPKTEWRYRFNPFGEREQKRMYQSPLGDTGNEMYPWVYYLLGVDNRQYATYYGMQSSDNDIFMSDYTYISKPEPYKPVTFFYPVEYNVFGNEQAPKMTYKYVNGQWQKQYKIYDYLGSLRYTMSSSGQVLNYKTYEPYGGTMLDTLGVTRQSYIGKAIDVESSLGDHGVRKYDYETGRFNSFDPLWEMYMGWTPYQYAGNNPVGFRDGNGMLIFANGDGVNEGINLMNDELSFKILRDKKTGQLSLPDGTEGKNSAEILLIEAIKNKNITLNLAFTANNTMNDINGNLQQVIGGLYGGSKVNEEGHVTALQGVNIEHFKQAESSGGDKTGQNIIHEGLEGYIGARDNPGTTYPKSFQSSHKEALRTYPLSGKFDLSNSYMDRSGNVHTYLNGIYIYTLPSNTVKIIQSNQKK